MNLKKQKQKEKTGKGSFYKEQTVSFLRGTEQLERTVLSRLNVHLCVAWRGLLTICAYSTIPCLKWTFYNMKCSRVLCFCNPNVSTDIKDNTLLTTCPMNMSFSNIFYHRHHVATDTSGYWHSGKSEN